MVSGSACGAFAPRAGRMLAPSRTLQVSTLDFVHRAAKTTLDFVQFAHSTTLVLDILHPDGRSNSPFRRARNRSARDIQNSDIQPCAPPGRRRRNSSTTSAANATASRRETSFHLTIGHSLIWKCVRLSNEDAGRTIGDVVQSRTRMEVETYVGAPRVSLARPSYARVARSRAVCLCALVGPAGGAKAETERITLSKLWLTRSIGSLALSVNARPSSSLDDVIWLIPC